MIGTSKPFSSHPDLMVVQQITQRNQMQKRIVHQIFRKKVLWPSYSTWVMNIFEANKLTILGGVQIVTLVETSFTYVATLKQFKHQNKWQKSHSGFPVWAGFYLKLCGFFRKVFFAISPQLNQPESQKNNSLGIKFEGVTEKPKLWNLT